MVVDDKNTNHDCLVESKPKYDPPSLAWVYEWFLELPVPLILAVLWLAGAVLIGLCGAALYFLWVSVGSYALCSSIIISLLSSRMSHVVTISRRLEKSAARRPLALLEITVVTQRSGPALKPPDAPEVFVVLVAKLVSVPVAGAVLSRAVLFCP
jgi:hypothetical protein